MNDVIAYCLAEAAARHKIELIAWLVMSDHYHAVVRDPEGQLPQFLEQFHKMVARVLNAKWERNENFWSSEETSVVYLPTPEDVFDKVVYVLSNPVADHLVETLEEWPGCSAQSNLGGKSTTHARPRFFFRENGTMPATATLTAVCPAEIRRNESVDAWTARVRAAVAERAEHLRTYRMREKIPILGRRRVLDAKHTDRAKKPEPFRGLKPCIACKDIARRIAELQALKHFREAHERARVRFTAGDHKVEFPAGTYRMRAWGARCEPYPALAA